MSSGENRTLEATPRKIARTRLAGQVAFSRDLVSGAALLAACVTLGAGGRATVGALVLYMRRSLERSTHALVATTVLAEGARAAGEALVLPLAVITVVALAVGLVQTRRLRPVRLLSVNVGHCAPQPQRLWREHNVALAGSEVAKIGLLSTLACSCLPRLGTLLPTVTGAKPSKIADGVFTAVREVAFPLALATAVLGLVDYLWQVHRHRKALRMSQDEVKREHREFEGDAFLKSERMRIHLEMAHAYALTDVAAAAVVVVDPGCTAVALGFDANLLDAPIVLRKGSGSVASRIQTDAECVGVPVVVDSNLAVELTGVDELDEIPAVLYRPVAELLADVKPELTVVGPMDARERASASADVL